MGKPKEFLLTYSKIAGTSHTNPDRTSRQKLIKKLKEGTSLTLVKEPDNPYDENAIKICNKKGKQLGYVTETLSESLATCIDNNSIIWAEVANITGGEEISYGCNIKVIAFQLRTDIEVLHEKEDIIKKRKKRDRLSFKKVWTDPKKKSFRIGVFLWDEEPIGFITDNVVISFLKKYFDRLEYFEGEIVNTEKVNGNIQLIVNVRLKM